MIKQIGNIIATAGTIVAGFLITDMAVGGIKNVVETTTEWSHDKKKRKEKNSKEGQNGR